MVFWHLTAITNSVNLVYSLYLVNWQAYILDPRRWYPSDESGDPVLTLMEMGYQVWSSCFTGNLDSGQVLLVMESAAADGSRWVKGEWFQKIIIFYMRVMVDAVGEGYEIP